MDDQLDPSIPVTSRYVLKRPFDRGGMGQLWTALDIETDTTVAIKFIRTDHKLDQDFHERFKREVSATSQVDSAHTVKLFDSGVHQGLPFLVMEYIRGNNLDELIRNDGPLPLPRAVSLLRQIVQGVADAHAVHVLHRDIKPLNVLVLPDGDKVKVCDFGIAKMLDEDTWHRITSPGHVFGSFRYMAPERFSSGGAVTGDDDVRSDLYSLGCLAYEMLVGQPPFAAFSVEDYGRLHREASPTPLREVRGDIPEVLARLVHALLAKRPAQRPPTADFTAAVLDSPPLYASGDEAGRRRLWALAEESSTMLVEADQRWRLGQHSDALQQYRQVVLRRSLMLGPGSPETLTVRLSELNCLCDGARARPGDNAFRECLGPLHQVVGEHAEHLGDEHPHTIAALQSLAAFLRELRDFGAALGPLLRVAQAQARTHGKDSPPTLAAEHEHACCLRLAGHPARAADQLRSVASRRANILGASDPLTGDTRFELGVAWAEAQEDMKAASEFGSLLAAVARTPHPRLSPEFLQQWLDYVSDRLDGKRKR
jgi:eukaryotic-like serine/threonine-protein kinase